MDNKEIGSLENEAIRTFNYWKDRRGNDLGKREENKTAIETAALGQALHPQSLREVKVWNRNVANETAKYFFRDHNGVFRNWVEDNLRIGELIDDKRVLEILGIGRRMFDLKEKDKK